jgi:hypothetical protein
MRMSEDRRDLRQVGDAFEEAEDDARDFVDKLRGDDSEEPEPADSSARERLQDDDGDITININR